MPRSYRRKPATRQSSSNIHPPPPKREPAPLDLLVAKGFTAWREQNNYSLEGVPFVPRRTGNDSAKVYYKITYKTSPQLSTADAEGTGTVEPHVFRGDLANDKIRLDEGRLISISSIEKLHLQLPDLEAVRALKNRVFSDLDELTYVGDLPRTGVINWSACFPQMTILRVQGEMSCSVFREIIRDSPELAEFIVNLLVQDSVGNGGPIEHSKLKDLEVVSYIPVKNAFNSLNLKALDRLKLWMMPNVVRELRYDDLGIQPKPSGRRTLALNFGAGEEFKEHATEGNWKFAVME